MKAALFVCWRTLVQLHHRGYVFVWANVLWFLLSIPIITGPAAWAGLVRMSRRGYLEPTTGLDDFWQGFRENLTRGIGLALLNALIIGVNLSNLWSYANAPGVLAVALRWVWLLVLFFWLALQLYLWPLYYEMKQPTLLGAMRNAALMILLNPLFTLVIMLVAGAVALLSTGLGAPWLLITGGLLAALGTGAVLDRLIVAGLRPPLPQPAPPEDIRMADIE